MIHLLIIHRQQCLGHCVIVFKWQYTAGLRDAYVGERFDLALCQAQLLAGTLRFNKSLRHVGLSADFCPKCFAGSGPLGLLKLKPKTNSNYIVCLEKADADHYTVLQTDIDSGTEEAAISTEKLREGQHVG